MFWVDWGVFLLISGYQGVCSPGDSVQKVWKNINKCSDLGVFWGHLGVFLLISGDDGSCNSVRRCVDL